MTEINSIVQVFKEAFSEHMLEFVLIFFLIGNKYLGCIVLQFQYISETELNRYSLLLIGQCVFLDSSRYNGTLVFVLQSVLTYLSMMQTLNLINKPIRFTLFYDLELCKTYGFKGIFSNIQENG